MLATVLVTLSVPLAPAASAMAACTWVGTQLAVPAGYSHVVPNGAADNSPFIVGTAVRAGGTGNDAVVWNNGVPQILPSPVPGSGTNRGFDVNDSGVVVGVWRAPNNFETPWRYENGTYQMLPKLNNVPIYSGLEISNPGDIIGMALIPLGSSFGLLWRASQLGQLINLGQSLHAIGIDDLGTYVLNTGVVVHRDGTTVTLPRELSYTTYSRGHVMAHRLGVGPTTIVELNLAGRIIRSVPGLGGLAVNAAGLFPGSPPQAVYNSVRNGNVWETMTPRTTRTVEITNGNVAIGDYNHDNDTQTPLAGGIWRQTCS